MAKILFTSFYQDKSPVRQQELELCIEMNIRNTYIDRIFILLEGDKKNFPILNNKKIVCIESKRPTYQTFFNTINESIKRKYISEKDITMVSNTDIFFDETIQLLDGINFKNTCLALSRWHYNKDHTIKLHQEKFSQDTWVFKGEIKPIKFCSFNLGVRGCDNRIAYELKQAGYNVINPARSIKTIHYHLSDLHNYGNAFTPKPYLPIELTELV